MTSVLRQAAEALREFALNLPGAYEDIFWGRLVIKVDKKIFIFMGSETEFDRGLRFGFKLPISGGYVLGLPFAAPSGYGLGKTGWVTVRFSPDDPPPLDFCQDWIMESYRTIAPKKLVAQLENSASD